MWILNCSRSLNMIFCYSSFQRQLLNTEAFRSECRSTFHSHTSQINTFVIIRHIWSLSVVQWKLLISVLTYRASHSNAQKELRKMSLFEVVQYTRWRWRVGPRKKFCNSLSDPQTLPLLCHSPNLNNNSRRGFLHQGLIINISYGGKSNIYVASFTWNKTKITPPYSNIYQPSIKCFIIACKARWAALATLISSQQGREEKKWVGNCRNPFGRGRQRGACSLLKPTTTLSCLHTLLKVHSLPLALRQKFQWNLMRKASKEWKQKQWWIIHCPEQWLRWTKRESWLCRTFDVN